jgi:hypothetical protein
MALEIMPFVQTAGSIASLVLIPIWKSLSALRREQEKTNIKLAEQYVDKNTCKDHRDKIDRSLARAHARIDEQSGGK